MTRPSTAALPRTMAIETRFGRFDVREDSVIEFPEGLPGFEKCRRFVLLSSAEIAPLSCLQGLDAPAPSFLAVDPRLVLPRYRCVLGEEDQARLAAREADLVWLALVTVVDGEDAAANLRAPVVIDSRRMTGHQVVHPRNQYHISHPLRVG